MFNANGDSSSQGVQTIGKWEQKTLPKIYPGVCKNVISKYENKNVIPPINTPP